MGRMRGVPPNGGCHLHMHSLWYKSLQQQEILYQWYTVPSSLPAAWLSYQMLSYFHSRWWYSWLAYSQYCRGFQTWGRDPQVSFMLNIRKPQWKSIIYDCFRRKISPETKTHSNEEAENRVTLLQIAEIHRKDGDEKVIHANIIAGLLAMKKQKSEVRPIKINFLKFEFVCCSNAGHTALLCVICDEMLANESLKPAKLKRHYT